MNVSLSHELRAIVDEGRFSSTSEYVRALIRHDQDRQQLRSLLLNGAGSEQGPFADHDYFAAPHGRVEASR